MRKKFFTYPYPFICLLIATCTAGCAKQFVFNTEDAPHEIRMYLSLSTLPPEGLTTRATVAHIPEVENLIRDIWVIQFNANGVRLREEHYDRNGEAGLYVENFEIPLVAASNSTVCLVVNTGNPNLNWANNFPDFQKQLLDIQASNDLSLRDRIPMCGYWLGNTTENQSLSASLCRMMTRIDLVINNQTGQTLTHAIVTLDNVHTEAYIYTQTQQDPLPPSAYSESSFTDTLQGNFNDGSSKTLYYYFAPNICEDESLATKVTITAKETTWQVILGTDSPTNSIGRDYSLYANNYYTFTLNLK